MCSKVQRNANFFCKILQDFGKELLFSLAQKAGGVLSTFAITLLIVL